MAPETQRPTLALPCFFFVELLIFIGRQNNNEKLTDPVQNANNLYMHCCFHVFSQEMTLKN